MWDGGGASAQASHTARTGVRPSRALRCFAKVSAWAGAAVSLPLFGLLRESSRAAQHWTG
jgi:hypothetical protein